MFVRESYVALADSLIENMNHCEDQLRDMENAAIYGTPGIGKSVFASMLIA